MRRVIIALLLMPVIFAGAVVFWLVVDVVWANLRTALVCGLVFLYAYWHADSVEHWMRKERHWWWDDADPIDNLRVSPRTSTRRRHRHREP